MGTGYELICSDCGKKYEIHFGCGFMFPNDYSELIKGIEAGRFGQEWQEIAAQTEHYAIDAESHLFRCEKCGYWECEPSLSIYAPKNEDLVSEREYVTAEELKSNYTLIKERTRTCARCGHDMRMLSDKGAQRAVLKCTKCGGRLKRSPYQFLWD